MEEYIPQGLQGDESLQLLNLGNSELSHVLYIRVNQAVEHYLKKCHFQSILQLRGKLMQRWKKQWDMGKQE